MNTAPATAPRFANQVTIADTIVTHHGRNYGTVEVWSIEQAGETPAGVGIVKITGYQQVNAGCCGPWEATYRADEYVDTADRGNI